MDVPQRNDFNKQCVINTENTIYWHRVQSLSTTVPLRSNFFGIIEYTNGVLTATYYLHFLHVWCILGNNRKFFHNNGKHVPEFSTRVGSYGPPHIVLCVR